MHPAQGLLSAPACQPTPRQTSTAPGPRTLTTGGSHAPHRRRSSFRWSETTSTTSSRRSRSVTMDTACRASSRTSSAFGLAAYALRKDELRRLNDFDLGRTRSPKVTPCEFAAAAGFQVRLELPRPLRIVEPDSCDASPGTKPEGRWTQPVVMLAETSCEVAGNAHVHLRRLSHTSEQIHVHRRSFTDRPDQDPNLFRRRSSSSPRAEAAGRHFKSHRISAPSVSGPSTHAEGHHRPLLGRSTHP